MRWSLTERRITLSEGWGKTDLSSASPRESLIKGTQHHLLYEKPVQSKRSGAFYSAFPYPTKLSAELVAMFVATHTLPGETVLDVFSGSGTTGLATILCEQPTPYMLELAKTIGASPIWGPRDAVLVDVSVLGSFVAEVLCNPPDPEAFLREACDLLLEVESELKGIYDVTGPGGEHGDMHYTIWSDFLTCPNCNLEISFWDAQVRLSPASIEEIFQCPTCQKCTPVSNVQKVYQEVWDSLLSSFVSRRRQIPVRICGEFRGRRWHRECTPEDQVPSIMGDFIKSVQQIPVVKIPVGDLHRSSYHRGFEYVHQFYTERNLMVFSRLWQKSERVSGETRDAIRFWLLSYNASHGTQMTRVSAARRSKEFSIGSAQSGVLYISNLPVENNLFRGLSRKAYSLQGTFASVPKGVGKVRVINSSSTSIELESNSVDYIFTDPPFGGNIAFAEVNFINEYWLGKYTDTREEAIVSLAQGKDITRYGQLLEGVFREASRVLRPGADATILFQCEREEYWRSLQTCLTNSGLVFKGTGTLSKAQSSFIETKWPRSVRTNHLLLVEKAPSSQNPNLFCP